MALEHISGSLGDLEYIQRRCSELAAGAKAVWETEEQIQARHRAKAQAWRIDRAKSESEVGTKFKSVTFAQIEVDSDNEAAFAVASDIVNANGKKGAGVWGAPGVGKSLLVAATVNALRDAGVVGVCISAPNLMLKFREGFDLDGAPSEFSIVKKLSSVPVLAIQDLGKEQFTPYTIQMLFSIMDARWENDLPLIVTSNMSPGAMIQHYSATPIKGAGMDRSTGPAMIDRVMDMTSAPWVQITGLSRRGVA